MIIGIVFVIYTNTAREQSEKKIKIKVFFEIGCFAAETLELIFGIAVALTFLFG